MLNRASRPLVKLVDKYLPDPYIFVLLLTLLVFAAAMLGQQKTPVEVLGYWGSGFWNLLSFSMQMLLVLVAGFMLASSPPVKKLLDAIASLARSAPQAIILVTLVSLAASWLNWGFGLVVGALFAKRWRAGSRWITVCWWPVPIRALWFGTAAWRALCP